MPTTPYLGLEDQNNGSNNNTWGDVADSNFSILEQSIARITTISTTGGTTTLTVQQNRFPVIRISGALVSNATIVVLSSEQNWTFINWTTGNFTVTVKTASGSGVLVPQGGAAQLHCDGVDVLQANVAFPSGTRMLFQQTAAPTGWTKDLTHNNKALRVVSGAAGSGGGWAFTDAFAAGRGATGWTSWDVAGGTVGGTALTIAQMPLHGHPFRLTIQSASTAQSSTSGGLMMGNFNNGNYGSYTGVPSNSQGQQIGGEGGGQAHDHSFTGWSHGHSVSVNFDMNVAYVDLIIAVKD